MLYCNPDDLQFYGAVLSTELIKSCSFSCPSTLRGENFTVERYVQTFQADFFVLTIFTGTIGLSLFATFSTFSGLDCV